MNEPLERNIVSFDRDVAHNNGYMYTTNARLSSELANRRLTNATLDLVDLEGKKVVDVGCGDGTYTIDLFDRGRPALLQGVDPAREAVDSARQKIGQRANLNFAAHSAYQLPNADDSFDVCHLRGVLHHLDRPVDALREAFRLAPALVVIEPNGYNPVVKLLERFSAYHVDHDEKSYAPRRLDRWISELGGQVVRRQWVGLVPFFCPDWFARTMKVIEPAVEKTPLVRTFTCGVYAFLARRTDP